MKTNAQVAAAFVAGETAQSRSMSTNGHVLYSYATPIARHDRDSIIVSTQKHSVTTTRHHSELWSAAHDAGYDGPSIWKGQPEEQRRAEKRGETPADTVPFHDDSFPGSRYGRAKLSGWPNGGYGNNPRNASDHDATAVVWRKLTEEEREAKERESREHTDRLLREALEEQGISMEEYHRKIQESYTD